MTSFGLPCACILSIKIRNKRLIRLGGINPRRQRLHMGEEEGENGTFVLGEWNDIQERLKKVPYKLKLHIKEVQRQLAFPKNNIVGSTSKEGTN